MPKMDFMIIGGAMANNFFKHEGFNIGKSLIEQNIETTIKSIYQESKRHECELILPIDVICSKKFDQAGENKKLSEVNDDDIILDIGIESTDRIDSILQKSKTVLWNGPFGLFEYDDFANGTNDISKSPKNSPKSQIQIFEISMFSFSRILACFYKNLTFGILYVMTQVERNTRGIFYVVKSISIFRIFCSFLVSDFFLKGRPLMSEQKLLFEIFPNTYYL